MKDDNASARAGDGNLLPKPDIFVSDGGYAWGAEASPELADSPDHLPYWDERSLRTAIAGGVANAQHIPTPEDINAQSWAGMDGAIAFHLIERHGENWSHVGRLMEAWRAANPPAAPAVSAPAAAGDQWRRIVEEVRPLIGRQFKDEKGAVWTFFGVVDGDDDYYYGMHNTRLTLLSCVGSIEGHGFELIEDGAHGFPSPGAGHQQTPEGQQ